MTILDLKLNRGTIRGVLLATGLGVVFGLQGWRLALEAFPIAMPWYLVLWVFIRHVALGFSIGVTAGSMPWWKRGLGLGALFGLPSALGLCAMNLSWAPRGAAVLAGSIAAGILIAFLTDTICPPAPKPAILSAPVRERPGKPEMPARRRDRSATGRRLADGKRYLEHLDSERERRSDPAFGQTAEDRVVWGELLELELQDIDDQVSRLHPEPPDS